jgi:hypothetical protein
MNGSTLKILMALSLANIAMTASSEAGKNRHKKAKESKQALGQKTPSRESAEESENPVLGEKSEKSFAPAENKDPVVAVSEDPVVESKDPVVEIKDPVVESRNPVVEIKDPVVEIKDPVVESRNPVVESKDPVVESKDPVVESKDPVVESKDPVVAVSEDPVVESKDPVVESKDPVVESKDPVVESKDPVVESKDPVFESKDPVVESRDPVVEIKDPVVEIKDPVVEIKDPVVEIKDPVVESKDPVVAVNEAQEEINCAPQQEPAPSEQITEEEIEEAFKELGRIRNETITADMRTEIVMLMSKLIPDSVFRSSAQKAALDEAVQLFLKSFLSPDVTMTREALLASVKAKEEFYKLDCTSYQNSLEKRIAKLKKTTADFNTLESISWHEEQIKKLVSEKAKNEKLLQENKVNHAMNDAALKKCTDEEEKTVLSAALNIYDEDIRKYQETIQQFNVDIESASKLKETFNRVNATEKRLQLVEFQIQAAKSEAEKIKLTTEKAILETSLTDDKKSKYYEDLKVLKRKKVEEETQKKLTEVKLQNSTAKKNLLTDRINFYELDWDAYVKLIKEKTQEELDIKAALETETALSKKQAQKMTNLERERFNLQKTNKSLNEELKNRNSNKKKGRLLSKINPFKWFKRTRKKTEE